jgi:hypothetical protein
LHDLLDDARPGRPLGRLGLDLHAISGLELHVLSSWLASLTWYHKMAGEQLARPMLGELQPRDARADCSMAKTTSPPRTSR